LLHVDDGQGRKVGDSSDLLEQTAATNLSAADLGNL
jgi:hypothetical protein